MQWPAIEQCLKQQLGTGFAIEDASPVSGGDINQAFQLKTSQGCLFIKLNSAARITMFEQEAAGLADISASQAIRTPNVVAIGATSQQSFLLLTWHQAVQPNPADWQLLGEQLAALHLAAVTNLPADKRFGFASDNFIGTTPQPNPWYSDWPRFFTEQRIGYQLSLLKGQLSLPWQATDICAAIAQQLSQTEVRPALLHGDLWSGNVMFDKHGPLLIDPACYVGDGEADIAMTRLFGGFPQDFYQAYRQYIAEPADSQYRQQIYNLYHVLNHATLFGGHYLSQVKGQLAQIVESR